MNGVVAWEMVVNVFTAMCRTWSLEFDMFTRERVFPSFVHFTFKFDLETKIKYK